MNPAQIPNAITVGRLVLIVPIVWGLLAGQYVLAFWLLIAAGVSDIVDGVLAKRNGWQSRFGAVLDPIADKAMFVAGFLTLAWLGYIPLWLVAVVFLRDILIVVFWAVLFAVRFRLTPIPSIPSKINTVVQTLCLGVAALGAAYYAHPAVLQNMFVLTLITTVMSGLHYLVIYPRRIIALRRAAA